ncbi:MAG: BlaI/MecI/CopY family transcriptional regulator [Acidobacteriota bacterium]
MSSTKQVPELGPLEFKLVRMVWKSGATSAREVQTRYNQRHKKPLAYTTVMTLLTRLVDKGVLAVDRTRQPYEFSSQVSREQLLRQRVQDFVDQFFEGQAVDLAVRLVEEGPLSQESIQRLEEILQRRSAQQTEPGRREEEPQ